MLFTLSPSIQLPFHSPDGQPAKSSGRKLHGQLNFNSKRINQPFTPTPRGPGQRSLIASMIIWLGDTRINLVPGLQSWLSFFYPLALCWPSWCKREVCLREKSLKFSSDFVPLASSPPTLVTLNCIIVAQPVQGAHIELD